MDGARESDKKKIKEQREIRSLKGKGGCGGDLDTLERVSEKRGVLSTNIWKSS